MYSWLDAVVRAFSFTWLTSVQIYCNQRNCLLKKGVHFVCVWNTAWPPFHCFGIPKRSFGWSCLPPPLSMTKLSSFPKVLNCRMFYFLLEICDEVFLIFKISSSSSLSSQVFCLFSRLNMVLISALLMKKVKQPSTSLQERGATKS